MTVPLINGWHGVPIVVDVYIKFTAQFPQESLNHEILLLKLTEHQDYMSYGQQLLKMAIHIPR